MGSFYLNIDFNYLYIIPHTMKLWRKTPISFSIHIFKEGLTFKEGLIALAPDPKPIEVNAGIFFLVFLITGSGPYRNRHHLCLIPSRYTSMFCFSQSLGCLMLLFQRRTIAV